eukprot:1934190-Rhodomonas_salina.1
MIPKPEDVTGVRVYQAGTQYPGTLVQKSSPPVHGVPRCVVKPYTCINISSYEVATVMFLNKPPPLLVVFWTTRVGGLFRNITVTPNPPPPEGLFFAGSHGGYALL